MKSYPQVSIMITASLLLLSGVSCSQQRAAYVVDGKWYFSKSEAVTVLQQRNDAAVSQVVPVSTPIGDSVLVVIPSDEIMAKVWFQPGRKDMPPAIQRELTNWAIQENTIEFLSMVDALRKRGLFEKVHLRRSPDPGQEHFEEDFALARPAQKSADWLLKSRRKIQQSGVPIQIGPPSLSRFQQKTIWLTRIEEAVRKLNQE